MTNIPDLKLEERSTESLLKYKTFLEDLKKLIQEEVPPYDELRIIGRYK